MSLIFFFSGMVMKQNVSSYLQVPSMQSHDAIAVLGSLCDLERFSKVGKLEPVSPAGGETL